MESQKNETKNPISATILGFVATTTTMLNAAKSNNTNQINGQISSNVEQSIAPISNTNNNTQSKVLKDENSNKLLHQTESKNIIKRPKITNIVNNRRIERSKNAHVRKIFEKNINDENDADKKKEISETADKETQLIHSLQVTKLFIKIKSTQFI